MELADIKKVGVVGSGTMGFGIALNFALAGYPTVMSDISDEILEQSMKNIKSALALFIEYEIITQKQADDAVIRITTTTDVNDVASNSDFITEAIFDRSKDKREMFNKLDELSPSHAIIASNTSSLVLSDFGSDVKRQDKIVLTHYFAPPHIVPGVEVGKGQGTSKETFDLVYDLMKKISASFSLYEAGRWLSKNRTELNNQTPAQYIREDKIQDVDSLLRKDTTKDGGN